MLYTYICGAREQQEPIFEYVHGIVVGLLFIIVNYLNSIRAWVIVHHLNSKSVHKKAVLGSPCGTFRYIRFAKRTGVPLTDIVWQPPNYLV
jgi:hypothetical protein